MTEPVSLPLAGSWLARQLRGVWPFWLMLLAGILGGFAFDDLPTHAPDRRGARYLLQVDLHTHTRLSDGFLSPAEVVFAARRRGLDAVAISEHNGVAAGHIGRAFSRWVGGPEVIVSEEVTSRDVHLLAIGIEHTILPNRDLGSVIEQIHAQGGVAIAAHPTRRYWSVLKPWLAQLDGAEVVHPLAYAGDERALRYGDIVEFYEEAQHGGHPLAAIGSSDFHFFGLMGLVRTYVLADSPAAADIVEAIRAHRTAAFAPNGKAFGDPLVIAEVLRQPPVAPPPPPYDSRHPLDAISRLLGLLGLLGLLLSRWSRD